MRLLTVAIALAISIFAISNALAADTRDASALEKEQCPRPQAMMTLAALVVARDEDCKCGTKTKCGQMNSCAEAMCFLKKCGVTRLDGDGDGTPCESICG